LEALAGRLAVEKRLKKAGVEPPGGGRFTGGRLRKALEAGDKHVRRELADAAEAVGTGVANVLAILNPKAFVLGGGVMEAVGDFLFPRIVRRTEKLSFGSAYKDCRLLRSALGDDAVVLGAAAAALGRDEL
jgi:glucokinase